MENNSISKNETYLPREDWLEVYGSNRILDNLTIYLMVPISLIGFLANSLCFFILSKKIFKSTPLFNYLKVYSTRQIEIKKVSELNLN